MCTHSGEQQRNLRSFIERQKCHVVTITTLASYEPGRAQIALTEKTYHALNGLYGSALDALWHEEFGYGTECLTEREGAKSWASSLELTRSEKESLKLETLEMYTRLETLLAARPRVYERKRKTALVAA